MSLIKLRRNHNYPPSYPKPNIKHPWFGPGYYITLKRDGEGNGGKGTRVHGWEWSFCSSIDSKIDNNSENKMVIDLNEDYILLSEWYSSTLSTRVSLITSKPVEGGSKVCKGVNIPSNSLDAPTDLISTVIREKKGFDKSTVNEVLFDWKRVGGGGGCNVKPKEVREKEEGRSVATTTLIEPSSLGLGSLVYD